MIEKIDPQIIYNVKTQDTNPEKIDCIVYANNFSNTRDLLLNKLKLKSIYEYPFIKAFGVSADYSTITGLAGLDIVNYITLNSEVTTLINVSKKILGVRTSDKISKRIPKFTVAVIDTGIDTILDLCSPYNRVVEFVDFVNSKETSYDDNGHGTFVSSVLAGNGLVSGGKYCGINPNAHLIGIKALDQNGETGAFTILESMQWVYDNKKRYNIKVVCMSFGSTPLGKKDPLLIGAEVLWNSGITVVSAAGNSGPEDETITAPGASSKIITVGAINDRRDEHGNFDQKKFEVARFSSRGPILGNYKPDIVTSGVGITSACAYNVLDKHYKKMNGTSVATPMVAGVCSLMLEKNPYLTPNEIKNILIRNAVALNNDRNSEGWGLLNANFLYI